MNQMEEITRAEQAGEYLMLGLRTTYGISEEEYRSIYPCSFEKINELLTMYEKHGWAVSSQGRWSFTPQGFLISNVLIGDILDVQTQQKVTAGTPWKKDEYEAMPQMSLFEKKNEQVELFHGIS